MKKRGGAFLAYWEEQRNHVIKYGRQWPSGGHFEKRELAHCESKKHDKDNTFRMKYPD